MEPPDQGLTSPFICQAPRTLAAEVIQGSVSLYHIPFDCCIILTDSWPSWVNLCLHFPSISVAIYWCQASSSLLASLATVSTFHWVSWDYLPFAPPANSLLLVQGTSGFISALPTSYLLHPSLLITCADAVPSLPFSGWSQAMYDASAYGGMVVGAWGFASTYSLPASLSSFGPFLTSMRLRHFLISTTRGGTAVSSAVSSSRFPFPQAEKCSNEYINTVRWIPQLACLHPSGLWGRECGRETCVLAPSVFTRSKLTIRPLAHSELGNIFSIPQVFMPILEQYPDVAFWTCVPGNLVVRVWDNMRALISDASVGESRLVNAPAPVS
jgi:hypothetical protein